MRIALAPYRRRRRRPPLRLRRSSPASPCPARPRRRPRGPDDVRVNQLIVYGDDPCPQSRDPNEITVCARLPDYDRYRVPPNLRDNPNDPASQAWAGRATELSYVGRTGTDSCSTVGGGGFTGCFNQIVSQARAERRAAGAATSTGPAWSRKRGRARAARIDAEAQAEEEDAQREEAARRPQ